MQQTEHSRMNTRHSERGMTLFLVAVLLVAVLAIAALAIDLSRLYVARSEAQRAADAAALAGAKKFVGSGFLSGFTTEFDAQMQATQEAITIGGQNDVAGEPAQILTGDVTFDFSNPGNPRITVQVQRTAARSNPVTNFFARAFGMANSDVSAVATAEAYAPSGGSIPVGTGCVKPWILPNCDPTHSSPENPNCPGSAFYVDTSTGEVVWPGSVSSGGVIGSYITIKPGLPQDSPAPGQFYPVQIPPGDEPALCPGCAAEPGGSEGPGAALYRHNISCCNTNQFVCGQEVAIDEQTGNMVGPTRQGIQCLINQVPQNCGSNVETCGQDYIPDATANPYRYIGGTNNPNPALLGQPITSSSSVVVVPLYDGYPLTSGESGQLPLVTVRGFVQLFVEKIGPPLGTVKAYVLNVAGCGGGASGGGSGEEGGGGSSEGGSSAVLSGPAGSPYPIRLIRPGD